jgi:hypothetical protein
MHAQGRRTLGGVTVGVRYILGAPPATPSVISAEVLRGLLAPDGRRPCRDGLRQALRWIGDREIPIEQARKEAQGVLAPSDIAWGLRALGISGDGDGFGHGFGFGFGSGYGFGDGYGDGYCDGSGSGYGHGSSYGNGYGSGDGYGYGDGFGDGSGYGEEI